MLLHADPEPFLTIHESYYIELEIPNNFAKARV